MLQKPENYNYYKNGKISYREWPEEVKEYMRYLSRIRRKPEWAHLTDEERKIERKKVISTNHQKWIDKYNNMTDEEKQKENKKKGHLWSKASPEKKEELREQLRERSNNFWNSMDDEGRKLFGRYRWNLKTDEEKANITKQFMDGNAKWRESLTQEDIDRQIQLMNRAYREKCETDPEFRTRQVALLNKHMHEYMDNLSDEDRKKFSERTRAYHQNLSDEEKEQRSQFSINRNNKWWATRTPEQLKQISERMVKFNQDMPPDMRRRSISNSNGRNGFHQKFELYFSKSYISNKFYIKSEEYLINDDISHFWDYGIYDKKTNTLQMVVDLDGEYFHGDSCDYNGIQSREEYDERRLLSVSEGLKYFIILEDHLSKSFEEMIKTVMTDYDTFIEEQFQYCRSIEFPYPSYTDQELINSYKQLLNIDLNSKYINSSTNSRIGDRLILHFHHTIYHARRGDSSVSPYEAWHDDDLLRKVIQNRIIYASNLNPNKILQGFNVSKIAPKVSVFSAARAKYLISKYLPNANEIFDPFSGFSGRMLGTISLGKKYIGQDIYPNHVIESSSIIEFLKQHYNLPHISLSEKNIFNSSGTYEALFTCPPYGDKEIWDTINPDIKLCDDWIDICLKHFKCKRYLFVIDHTEKYKEYIVDEIINKSHFNSGSKEYIVLIK